MLQKQIISLEEASKIIADEESHFLDFKSKDISGSKLQKSAVAFANADGGEILVGIEDPRASGRASIDRWNGFNVQEEANQLIQTISQDITPYPPVEFEFYEVDMLRKKGFVLKINIAKSSSVHTTSDNQVYERKNAQNLPII